MNFQFNQKSVPPLSDKPESDLYNIAAKETLYNGIVFRSRAEARWAVFFDYLGWEWQYEPERFTCCGDDPETYLPDFYLPTFKLYAEVKGSDDLLFADQERISGAIDWGATPVSKGLLLLGSKLPFDASCANGCGIYGDYLYWDKGVVLGRFDVSPWKGGAVLSLFQGSGLGAEEVSSWPEIPSASSVDINLGYSSEDNTKKVYYALCFARRARFDFDDSVNKAINEGRTIIGGIKK